ncbi:DUF1778 domain-containing protein [Gallibacterium genomosp. 3]|uniref:type II toxin -antitoxin system TacA 1-like antitoxin n=1 Tax=Gallibacterium genomosp. 3 TaxID=505345 RepID=UPI0009F3066E|nr:DUF1778 domain-containing protein [Gallibacterium genomosp. 3]
MLTYFIIDRRYTVTTKEIVEKNELIHLSITDQQKFAEALISLPELNQKIQEALHLNSELLED